MTALLKLQETRSAGLRMAPESDFFGFERPEVRPTEACPYVGVQVYGAQTIKVGVDSKDLHHLHLGGSMFYESCFGVAVPRQTVAPMDIDIVIVGCRPNEGSESVDTVDRDEPEHHWLVNFGRHGSNRLEYIEPLAPAAAGRTESEAAELIRRIKAFASDIRNDDIAELLDISRRSVQSWLAGGKLSADNLTKLRRVTEVMKILHEARPNREVAALQARSEGGVSLAMLLREGRFNTALARIRGEAPTLEESLAEGKVTPAVPVEARLGAEPLAQRPSSSTLNRSHSTLRQKPKG